MSRERRYDRGSDSTEQSVQRREVSKDCRDVDDGRRVGRWGGLGKTVESRKGRETGLSRLYVSSCFARGGRQAGSDQKRSCRFPPLKKVSNNKEGRGELFWSPKKWKTAKPT